MKFLLDHDVPIEIARLLRREGHEVSRLGEVLSVRTTDPEVLAYAHSHELVLISANRQHFLELCQTNPHCGLVILIRRKTRQNECAHVLQLLRRAGEAGIGNNINFA
jgi:predicted nuclease of predicted toxin-antitoxin system